MDLEKIKTSDFEYGLSKILRKQILEVNGYISTEYDSLMFKMTNIMFTDGTNISCEGEHDCPYLAYNDDLDQKCIEINNLEE